MHHQPSSALTRRFRVRVHEARVHPLRELQGQVAVLAVAAGEGHAAEGEGPLGEVVEVLRNRGWEAEENAQGEKRSGRWKPLCCCIFPVHTTRLSVAIGGSLGVRLSDAQAAAERVVGRRKGLPSAVATEGVCAPPPAGAK